MNLYIDNRSGAPIYDQIYTQIKNQIISGELEADITTKRAYEELEREGFLYTLPGKGCFVAPKNVELLREETLKQIEGHMEEIWKLAAACQLSREELMEMFRLSMEE